MAQQERMSQGKLLLSKHGLLRYYFYYRIQCPLINKARGYAPGIISTEANSEFNLTSYGIPGGTSGEDIYVSRKTETGWSIARPIGPLVSTVKEESSPRFRGMGSISFSFQLNIRLHWFKIGGKYIFVETEHLQLDPLFN